MKIRNAFALALLLPLMVACKAQDGTADVTPAPAPATTEAAPAATDTPEAAVVEEATVDTATTAGPIVPPQGPAPVEGEDFIRIDGGVPFAPDGDKIEVVEVFGYVCPACFRFQPVLAPWKSRLPADVNFVYVPAVFGGTWDDYARAFYAAQTLGVLERTHEPLYKAIHLDSKLKGERGRDSIEDIAGFYATQGVDAKQFQAAIASFGVNAQTARAKQFAVRSKISGTPSLIVGGKYLVKGKSYEDMLRITDHLIASERAALGR